MRYGLIGCGGIGALRAQALGLAQGVGLAAVCDADPARARALAGKHGAAVEADWRRLVERKDIDAVIVSTPPHLHAEMAIRALHAGKHVLSEKPLARDAEEARAMVAAAESSRSHLATGFNYRFYPSVVKARELMASGIIGELDHIRSYAGYSARDHNPEWVHDAEVMGGGALRDNGIHLIDLTRVFLGDVAEVKGFATDHVWGFDGCEDNGFALLKNDHGRVASLHASWNEWLGYRLLVEVYGTLGVIRTWCFPMRTQVTWSRERAGKMHTRTDRFLGTMLQEHLKSYRWLVVQSFITEIAEFGRAVRGERSVSATGLDGLRALEVAAAVAHAGPRRDAAMPTAIAV